MVKEKAIVAGTFAVLQNQIICTIQTLVGTFDTSTAVCAAVDTFVFGRKKLIALALVTNSSADQGEFRLTSRAKCGI